MENNAQSLQQSFINLGKALKNLSSAAVKKVVDTYQNNYQNIDQFANKTKTFVTQNKEVVSIASVFLILSLAKARANKKHKMMLKQQEDSNKIRNEEQQKAEKERNSTVEDLLNKLEQNTAETVDKNLNIKDFSPIKHKNQYTYRRTDYRMPIESEQQQESQDQRDKIFFQVYKNYLNN